ncbi:hypothetical protein BKA63DRAFT_526993 [Paraphoma chrysanthemicola]|nr:hypothetical protein BKA63DRAFT_526993 [Paraphoma chrysanthemicola]
MQSTAASEAWMLRQERNSARARERGASNRLDEVMEFAKSTQETADSILNHERASASAAISRMQTNAASEAALLRQERNAARAGARQASNHLDDVINTLSYSEETADAVLSHERRVFGETVSQMRTTAAAETDIMRFGRDVRSSMLDTTHGDLAAAKEDLRNKDDELTDVLDLHDMQLDIMTSIDQATLSTMSAVTSKIKRKYDLSGVYKDIEARAQLSDARAQISEKDREIFNLHDDCATSERRVVELDDAINHAGEEVRDACRADKPDTQRGCLERAVGFLTRATVGDAYEESDSEMVESGEE